jgi:opacity protein-like surface antigen
MKNKFLALLLSISTFFICQESFARKSKIFIGLNGYNVSTSHLFIESAKVTQSSGEVITPYRKDTSSSNFSFGASAGYIAYYRKFFVSPEIFFDYLDSKTKDFFASERIGRITGNATFPYKDDEILINYRFGARMNVGYSILDRLAIYANIGAGVVDYDLQWYSTLERNNYGGFEMSPIYGLGLSYDLNKNLILRAAHDYQQVKLRYIFQGQSDQVDIHTTRLGLLLAF